MSEGERVEIAIGYVEIVERLRRRHDSSREREEGSGSGEMWGEVSPYLSLGFVNQVTPEGCMIFHPKYGDDDDDISVD